ncbi:MAG TPA: TonB-dependent receptor [Blastocatellia bacterium]|nr:TonB-dependent receptor [Blastocatellia bacterium]
MPHSKSLLKLCLSLLACLFLVSSHIIAADDLDHFTIEGRVTDANGQAITGATVTARHLNTGQERSVTSNEDGRFRLSSLLPGEYELRAEMKNFRSVRVSVSGAAGTTLRQNFRLEVAALTDAMTVEAGNQQAQVDTARTVIGGTLTRRQIDELPSESRNIYDLIVLFAGASPPAFSENGLAEGDTKDRFRSAPEEAGIFGLNGGTPFSNNLTIEGLDNNDDRAARERFVPTTDAVDEFQVISNQFSAEYGRASGGRVNLRLRSGTNQFRGRGFYYFRDESLNANSVTRNSDPARGFRLPYQQNNPGLSFGGPLVPNRAWFFAAYEYDNIYDRTDIAALVPTVTNPAFVLPLPTGANLGSIAVDKNGKPVTVNGGAAVGLYDVQVTTPRTAHTFQTRSDFSLGNRHTAFVLVALARNRDERGFPGGRRTLDTLRRTGRNSEAFAVADNFVISPNVVNVARFQFSRLTPADGPLNQNPVVLIEIDDPRDVIGNASANPLTRAGNLLAGSSNASGTDRRETRWQFQNTLSFVAGRHTLRAGTDLQAIRSSFIDLADVTGTFRFASPADFLANRPSRYQHRFSTASELRNTYAGLFVQNDWRIRPNFTFSFGLRWDNETILRDRNNFSPRLALVWDPFGSAKTVVRAGYGIFYNRALLRTLDDFVLTSNKILVDTDNEIAKPLLAQLQFPQTLSASDPRVSQFGVREAEFIRKLSWKIRIPESYQAAVGIEREIGKGFTVEVNYVFSRGLHLWRESNANAPRLPAGFRDWAEYLTSRDFNNAVDPVTRQRPITSTGNADIVRFSLSTTPSETRKENGKTVVIFGLNNPSTSNASSGIKAALAAVRNFRPDPQLTQIELLESRGNSFYHGVSFELQRRFASRAFIRAVYTLSKLIDDGVVNTSSPLVAGDFRRERALSLLDARHRLAVSGTYQCPVMPGRISVAGIFTISSARPFTPGINGNDRNLDDVNNDRPNFTGTTDKIRWRRPGQPLDPSLVSAFSLPTIGTSGNLGRNAGRGPAQWQLSLRLSRRFRLGERRELTPQIEVFNPSNSTVYAFGAEFVDYVPSSLGSFLTPARVFRPRTLRVGLRFEF